MIHLSHSDCFLLSLVIVLCFNYLEITKLSRSLESIADSLEIMSPIEEEEKENHAH